MVNAGVDDFLFLIWNWNLTTNVTSIIHSNDEMINHSVLLKGKVCPNGSVRFGPNPITKPEVQI